MILEKARNVILKPANRIRDLVRGPSKEDRIKRLLGQAMGLFDELHDEFWADIKPRPELALNQKYFQAVQTDGLCVIPDYLTPEQVKAAQQELFAVPGYLDAKYDGAARHKDLNADGIFSMEITQPELPVCYSIVAQNPEIDSIARALFGEKCKLSAASALNKYNPDRVDSSVAPHWDDWRPRFKAFYYLTDVGEDQAPTIYVKKSHRGVPAWRREKDFASMYLPIASAGGSWWPVEQLGLEKVLATGKAGTLVLLDTLGIHAGTQLRQGRRVILMGMYTNHLPYTYRAY